MYRCCPSVCLSVCPLPPPRGKTKRPRKTKLGRKGPWDTSTPWTNFEVKGSKVLDSGSLSNFRYHCVKGGIWELLAKRQCIQSRFFRSRRTSSLWKMQL